MGLNLAHELLLLDLDEAKGSEPLGSMLSYGLVGAVLAELALADRIHLDDNRVVIVSSAALGVNSLDLVLSAIAGHEPLDPEAWVQRLEGRVKEPVANELVSAGILSHRHRHLLGFLADERYPEVDPGPERALRARLDAVVVDGAPADPRTAALAALLDAIGMARNLFHMEGSALDSRLTELSQGQWAARAVRSVVTRIGITMATIAATPTGMGFWPTR